MSVVNCSDIRVIIAELRRRAKGNCELQHHDSGRDPLYSPDSYSQNQRWTTAVPSLRGRLVIEESALAAKYTANWEKPRPVCGWRREPKQLASDIMILCEPIGGRSADQCRTIERSAAFTPLQRTKDSKPAAVSPRPSLDCARFNGAVPDWIHKVAYGVNTP